MKRQLATVFALGALALAGCNEGTAPTGSNSSSVTGPVTEAPTRTMSAQEAAPLQAAMDQSGWTGTDFGAVGATSEFQNDGETWATSLFGSAAATVSVPEFWGRLRGEPVLKTRIFTEKGDTAWASTKVDYNGAFLVDLTPGDGKLDVTSKPLVESMVQQARFEKSAPNPRGERSWVLVGITPQQFVATDPAKQTVKITEVIVSVNDVVKIDITDPTAFEKILQMTAKNTGDLPLFHRGDKIKIVVKVANTTGTNNTPPTFAFMSSFHADPNGLGWRRMQMVDGNDNSYSLTWEARQSGRERIIVEALDAQSFVTPTEDDYRANVWAIPYQIQ